MSKPRLFKRAGVWFCAVRGWPGVVAGTPQEAYALWKGCAAGEYRSAEIGKALANNQALQSAAMSHVLRGRV